MTEQEMYEAAKDAGLLGANVGTTKWEDAIFKLCRSVAEKTLRVHGLAAINEINDDLAQIAAHLAEQGRESAALTDATRVNWLEANLSVMIRHFPTYSPPLRFQFDGGDGQLLGVGSDLRSALDAAIRNTASGVCNA